MDGPRFARIACTLSLIAALAPRAQAAPLEVAAAFDLQGGPGDATYRTGFVGVGRALGPRVGASLLVARTEESSREASHAVAAGLVGAASSRVRLRGWAVRSIAAPEGGGFTRWIAGPELGPADGVRAGLFYTHETNEAGDRSQGGRVELTAPLAPAWTATLTASRATIPGAAAAEQALAGLAFKPLPALEIAGQVGLARGATAPGFVPRRSPLDRLLGDPPPGAAEETNDASGVAIVGVRVALP